ncbi:MULTISPECIES: hormogonium polysaccharide biosynthesis protein HpsA [Cyanophyceae]|uniref:hormogonium polysaccharide biosynthesis protein HpsA n=1 Tax=Cyanophyceae TaxID=3028117 RepID=UPI0016841FF4|nr:hormogonium polysaccharide biosynthesis protein HpsA [Trichocoleus sp. FACHB-832]MBD1908847.1 hypothetical protein [Trichocoleus sp. FACHB-832]
MSPHKKLLKAIQNLFREMVQIAKAVTKKLMNWLLRSILVTGKKANLANAGFILPTVTMVILVVILLTTAMVFRSFERSKNASNVRVNQAVLAAATPALDRAKAKISALLEDPTLPRSTPTDVALNQAISGNINKYTLGDETQLVVKYDINGGGIQESTPQNPLPLDNDEKITTAWRFPVDTDNNGTPDSYTLYGIYFRTPNPVVRTANPSRSPIEARTAPQDDSSANPQCAAAQGTFAGLVGSSGWYKSGSVLKKSFYVFAATVPNTTAKAGMEVYKGNRGFSAIEYQQDRAQIPLSNNAVVYEDDLEITPGSGIKLNGRIQTNGNFFTGEVANGDVEYYQVSSYKSCFFQEENGKITVGGNILLGSVNGSTARAAKVDLFQPSSVNRRDLRTGDQSVSGATPSQAAYNSQAFANRVNTLVQKWTAANPTFANDPTEVKEKIPGNASALKQEEIRLAALENYFRLRMRGVPYAENTTPDPNKTYVGTGDTLRPPDEWIYPVDPNTGTSNNSITIERNKPSATEPTKQKSDARETNLGDRILVGNGLPAIWWDNTLNDFVGDQGKQQVKPDTAWDSFSDPANRLRYRTTQVVPLSDLGNTDRDGFWEENAAKPPVQGLDGWGGMRVVTGAGVYTGVRIISPTQPPVGPLRDVASFLPPPPAVPNYTPTINVDESQFTVVWPDSMPMWEDTDLDGTPDPSPVDRRGDLVMRATAVYHYKRSAAQTITSPQAPIACVSSYYDPSTSATAKNSLTGSFAGPPGVIGTTGRSNNGISYAPPPARPTASAPPNNTTGLFPVVAGAENPASSVPVLSRLYYQANLIFPNGRFVNEPLRDALTALSNNAALTLAQQSALDSTICALTIADNTLPRNTSVIPDGAIYETSFLDSREIKAIEQDNNPTDDANGGLATFRAVNAANQTTITQALGRYDLPLEERQPLENRVTVLDLSKLRQTTIGGLVAPNGPTPEFLLPDSGIIYATRDDALPDLSAPTPGGGGNSKQKEAVRKSQSPVDFKLDPTRKPNGIMLVNGSILARGGATPTNAYTLVTPPGAEKGLILATNLPAYVKADVTNSFNKHQTAGGAELEEFVQQLGTNAYAQGYFYGRQTPDNRFACRSGQPGINCAAGGDLWRTATVLADSVSLLSNDFRFGFRNEGDYDLRNNQGDPSSIAQRKKDGFLSNNFVTNGLSSGATVTATNSGSVNATLVARRPVDATYTSNTPDTNYVPSSYFNNFVTPIQRRGQSREYVMEICRKLPVTECTADDWVVGYDFNGNNSLTDTVNEATVVIGGADLNNDGDKTDTNILERDVKASGLLTFPSSNPARFDKLGSGTTDRPSLVAADQRYARRVAFQRDTKNGLVLTPASLNTAIPLGINPTGQVQGYPYTIIGTPSVPRQAPNNNALAFRTTTNITTTPWTEDYRQDRPLFYLQPANEREELLLPDIAPNIPTNAPVALSNAIAALNGPTPALTPPIDNDDPSDFAICLTNGAGSNQYQVGNPTGGACSPPAIQSIRVARNTLARPAALGTVSPLTAGQLNANINLPLGNPEPDNVYVYNIPPSGSQPDVGATASDVTITLKGNSDSIFIFRKLRPGNLSFGRVTLKLDGVNPNNIFWVSRDAGISFTAANKLAGNFLSNGGPLNIPTNTEIVGGRFLGFNGPTATIQGSVKAMTAQAEPLLVPVLQYQLTHQPVATDPDTAPIQGGIKDNSLWLQRPSTGTIFNLAAAGGDSPNNGARNEQNGGLQNFVRFLENWKANIPARISGSFIQFKRSAYATAPFKAVTTTLTPPTSPFGYTKLYSTTISSINPTNPDLGGGSPFYVEPNRFWGFDVALLSQIPDLFSQRFTTPSAGDPNEFYREVGRDDEWVKTLLCAKQASNNAPAIDPDQRPAAFCVQKTGG